MKSIQIIWLFAFIRILLPSQARNIIQKALSNTPVNQNNADQHDHQSEQEPIEMTDKDADRIQKRYPDKYYWEIRKKQEELDQEKQKNEKAQEQYEKNPEGNDLYTKDNESQKEGKMIIKVERDVDQFQRNYNSMLLDKQLDDDENRKLDQLYIQQELKEVHVLINEHQIYFLNEEDGYRGVIDSLSMDDLYNPKKDNVMYGSCCESIGIIDIIQYGSQALYCFKADGKHKTWTICSPKKEDSLDWRVQLISNVIIYGLKQHDSYQLGSKLMVDSENCEQPEGWSYELQSQWGCECQVGLYQSPIDIPADYNFRELPKSMVNFQNKNHTTGVVFIYGLFSYLQNDYGYILLSDEHRKIQKFQVHEIYFRFKSEHKINNKQYPCEMQFKVQNSNGMVQYLSIFISDKLDDMVGTREMIKMRNQMKKIGDEGYFDMYTGTGATRFNQTLKLKSQEKGTKLIERFFWSIWPKRKKKNIGQTKCVDHDDLNFSELFGQEIISGSFYEYVGSDTMPPCSSDIIWTIMIDPIIITTILMNEIQEMVLGNMDRNNRDTQPLNNREILVHHDCPRYHEEVVVPKHELQYVQTVEKQITYGVFDNDQVKSMNESNRMIDKHGHNYTFQLITAEQMKQEAPVVQKELIKKYSQQLYSNIYQ